MKKLKHITTLFAAVLLLLFAGTNGNVSAAEKTEAPQINYTVLSSGEIKTSETQNIVVSIGTAGEEKISSAKLTLEHTSTGKTITADASKIYQDAVLFEIKFDNQLQKGNYSLKKISFVYDGKEYATSLKEGAKKISFDVNPLSGAENLQVVSSSDSDGVKESDLKLALSAASMGAGARKSARDIDATGSSKLDIVLDAGHGGTDSGAVGNGMQEKNVTLKIAQYLKKELEKYDGVKVSMTRDSDTYLSLNDRVALGVKNYADIFVCLHINSAVNAAANGAEVYYPNANYKPSYGSEGQGLATQIQKKLTALGLSDRGIKIYNSQTGNTYPDGSLSDYYAIIRGAKEAGFPAIIVEHAFISNASDAAYINSDSALKKLAKADAEGIAAYYKLKLKTEKLQKTEIKSVVSSGSSGMKLSWNKVKDASGYQIYRSNSKNGEYQKIKTISSGKTTSYKDTSVKAGKKYYYKVRCYKEKNNDRIYSSYSGVKSQTVLKKVSVRELKAKSSSEVFLKWKKTDQAAGYEIYRSTKKNGTFQKIATIKSGKTVSYTDKKLSAGKTYYYKIRAYKKSGEEKGTSDYSNAEQVKLLKAPSVSSVKKSGKTLKVTWKKVSGAEKYVVYRSTKQDGGYKKTATVKKNAVSYKDTNVKKGKKYYYKVRAVCKAVGGNSYSSFGKEKGKKM